MRLHLLDLLDTVAQHDDDGVLVTQPGQPATPLVVLGGLDRQQDHVDRAVDLGGIGAYRAGHHDRVGLVGPKFDLRSRCPSADQQLVTGGVKVAGDRGSDGARADNCNIHNSGRNYRL